MQQYLQRLTVTHSLFEKEWPQDFTGFTDVWLAGGDGTLNYFINRYPDMHLPVALFKGGSGNDFAWKLYGEKSTADYAESALATDPIPVDAGTCNGKTFLNGAGIGFDGEVVKAMGKKRIFSAGHIAYLVVVIRKIFSYREKELELTWGGRKISGKYFLVAAANGSRYGGGFLLAPAAKIDDGKLDLVIIKKIHPLKRLFLLPKVERGKHLALPEIEYVITEKLVVHATDSVNAHLDGELMTGDKFAIEILPAHFRFYC